MRLTGCCAKVKMGIWSVRVKEILLENNMRIWLATGYIDDIRFITNVIKPGWRWSQEEKKLVYKEDWREEDERMRYSKERKTCFEVLKIMNSVFKDIKFTVEAEEDFKTSRIPTLDFEMWLEKAESKERDTAEEKDAKEIRKGKVIYSFYEKEMSSNFCIMENTAMSWNQKRASLSQEVIRRMLNTSELVSQTERDTILEKFISRMEKSGYSKKQIRDITMSGLKGYETKRKRAAETGQELHRSGASTLQKRYKKKLTAKTNWYKQKRRNTGVDNSTDCHRSTHGQQVQNQKNNSKVWHRSTHGQPFKAKESTNKNCHHSTLRQPNQAQEKNPTAVIFVPRTPDGELAQLLRDAEQQLQKFCISKVKIVEESGDMAKSLVHRANPWAGENCARENCMLCSSGEEKPGDCRKRNATYFTECKLCLQKGKKVRYVGETARTCFERGLEHADDAAKKKDGSHIHNHLLETHSGEEISEKPFKMKVIQQHRSALSRQIQEAVIIANSQGVELLNSKTEYNRCIIPRLAVMVGTKERDTGKEKWIEENEIQEMEESTGRRKREANIPGLPTAKRRKDGKEKQKSVREREKPSTNQKRDTAREGDSTPQKQLMRQVRSQK